ncbi:MAG: TolC family protein [Sulfurimonas sp.]|jgi:outer membrane protein TolC|uniref:TolC family protein n=1 Tax=Sulfurimonas sp. TaxID=2022749 RepID=UPI002627A98D|nr:TolC family protein [Sulfurimonas sp.]MDD3476716.1 TolC family protein [Sulfurimonas sp.]
MSKFLSLFLVLFLFGLHAQTLTLDECIDKTLKNHPDIKKLSLNVSRSNASIDIAKADYLPQINASAQYNPINTFVMPQNGQFNTIEDDNWLVSAQLNQKIYDYSKTTSTINAYKKDKEIAALSLEDRKALLVYNVKIQYDIALLQTNAIEVRLKDLQTKEELYNQAEAFVRAGLKTQADALSLLSAVYVAEDNLAATRAELDKAISTLSIYIGEKIDPQTSLRDDSVTNKNNNIQDSEILFENVITKNYEIKSYQEQISRDGFIYDASKAQHYGSIDAVAIYTHQDSLNAYDTSLVGVTINVPIYSGGRISAQTQQARIAKEESQEAYNSKKLLLEEETQALVIDLQKYRHTLKAKEALIESSQAAKEIVEARYKEGLSTYIEVLDASSTYLLAELGLLEAKFNINNIMNRLDYLQGNIQ